jgi:hypothetical protein
LGRVTSGDATAKDGGRNHEILALRLRARKPLALRLQGQSVLGAERTVGHGVHSHSPPPPDQEEERREMMKITDKMRLDFLVEHQLRVVHYEKAWWLARKEAYEESIVKYDENAFDGPAGGYFKTAEDAIDAAIRFESRQPRKKAGRAR